MSDGEAKRYIVIPALNAFNAGDETPSVSFSRKMAHFFGADDEEDDLPSLPRPVEQIDGDEASVMILTETERLNLSALYPGLQIAEEGELRMLPVKGFSSTLTPAATAKVGAKMLDLTVRSAGKPLADADVTVVFSVKNGTGIGDLKTDAKGKIEILLPPKLKSVELVIVTPKSNAWPVHRASVNVENDGATIRLEAVPIDEKFEDSLSLMTSNADRQAGAGVRVAVVDGGISGPADLNIAFNLNTTGQEPADKVGDNGSGHGTHVASIIRRLAPGVELYNYRVFIDGADTAREAAIARAIRHAVDNECDLINLSLGQLTEPIAIIREVRRARAFGAVCVAAAGNDFGGSVNYPARSNYVHAVAALGHMGGWPDQTARELDIDKNVPRIGEVFYAGFSNRGQEIDFAMPGAGVVGWVAPDKRGVMSGTSMACPAVVGMMARLVASSDMIKTMDRDQARSDEIAKLTAQAARPIGFGAQLEGQGALS